jgi:hypothetical protein
MSNPRTARPAATITRRNLGTVAAYRSWIAADEALGNTEAADLMRLAVAVAESAFQHGPNPTAQAALDTILANARAARA